MTTTAGAAAGERAEGNSPTSEGNPAASEGNSQPVQDPSGSPRSNAKPEPSPTSSGTSAATGTQVTETGTTGTGPEAEPEPENGTDTAEAEAEPDTDPGAAAAAKSRLPALVRTMTATAIDRPQQTGPVGRPGKAVLAGAAVAGALLVSVPFLVLGGHDDKDRERSASAGTVLGGSGQEAPGEFAVTESGSSSPSAREKDSGKNGNKPQKPVRESSASAPAEKAGAGEAESPDKGGSQKDADRNDPPKKKQDSGTKAGNSAKSRPAGGGSGVTFSAPVSLRSHLSGRCVDVPWSDFSDGAKLFVWDCNGSAAQQWRFASDGTIRVKDKCLDVANANFNDGTPLQIAWCNGNAAQKFALNGSHDLVNTVVGKCVDIRDNNRDNGAWLQLWSCNGADTQKWSA
ncbi:ricin-type beta-trefoil lectin domain protein [Streptomyces sp. D2-8]|uniref:ricin-type beta-trefoil lectin domain protein n=1 Tax=Streptomyces sp. D2-8 TaxID=2707767 RepID=UPI0020BD6C00|nr:ricin-type beta-trefoil lectin domain protein [Streptomyces sp. D2-8]